MTQATCLRCDWQGATDDAACPRCGEPLYRPGLLPRVRAAAPPPAAIDPVEPEAEPEPEGPNPRRSSPWTILAAMAAVAAVLALLLNGVPERRPAGSQVLRGTLVYVGDAGGAPADRRLWKLDLATGGVARGPRVPEVEELRSAPGAGPGWMVFTARLPDGRGRAYVLHGTAPTDLPVALSSGDLVSWGPYGLNVVVARRGPLRTGCRRDVAVGLISVESGSREPAFRQRDLCGDILSIGRDGATTYFTRLRNGRIGIFFTGYKVAHPVLRDYALVSVSPASDMFVTPTEGMAGTVLYWRGRGGPVPLSDGKQDLFVLRVLAWSPDATLAVVAGELGGGGSGIFVVRAGPGDERRVPTRIAPIGGPTGAAFSDDGVAYLALDGRLYAYLGGRLSPIPLPAGAPRPAGPIAWMP